jgi:hypothetical protein
MQVGFKIVMTWHGVLLAALLVQAQPEPPVLRVDVFDAHADGRADAGEGIDHQPDQRAVAEADDSRDGFLRNYRRGGQQSAIVGL